MKLFYRVLMHLLMAIVVVLSGWAIVFYGGIMDEINDEVDDSLEDYSELIITRSLAGKELPSNDNGSNNQYYLTQVDASYALSNITSLLSLSSPFKFCKGNKIFCFTVMCGYKA